MTITGRNSGLICDAERGTHTSIKPARKPEFVVDTRRRNRQRQLMEKILPTPAHDRNFPHIRIAASLSKATIPSELAIISFGTRRVMASDGGRVEKPQTKPAAPKAPEATTAGVSVGTQAGSGASAIAEERRETAEKALFRMSGGTQGTPPLANLAAQRGAPVRTAVARMMRKADGNGAAKSAAVPQGGGASLPKEVRAKMEPQLGADLSGVKIHTGGDSQEAASNFGARAFTVGSDVHFNSGQFAPGSKEGDRLLAHELTHVVQGQKSGVQRKAEDPNEVDSESPDVSQPGEPAEQEADAVGDAVAESLHEGKDGDDKAEAKKGGGKADEKAGGKKDGEKAGAKKGGEKDGGKDSKPKDSDQSKMDPSGGAAKPQAAAPAAAAGGGDSAGGDVKAVGEQKPAAISAKLEGVGRKVFLAKSPSAPPGPPGKPAKPGAPATAKQSPEALAATLPTESYTEVGGNAVTLKVEAHGETATVKAGDADAATKSDSANPMKLAGEIKAEVEAFLKAKPEEQPALLPKIKADMKALRTAMSKARGEDNPVVALRTTFEKDIGAKTFAGTGGFAGADAAVTAMCSSAMTMMLASKGQAISAAATIDQKLKELEKLPELKDEIERIGIPTNIGFAGAVGKSFDAIAKTLSSGSLTERAVHLINFGDNFLKKHLIEGTAGVMKQIEGNLSSGQFTELEGKIQKVKDAKTEDGTKEAKKGLFSTADFQDKVNSGGAMDTKTPQVPLEALDRAALFRMAKQNAIQTKKTDTNDELLAKIKAGGAKPTSGAGQTAMPDKAGLTKEGMPYIQGIKANIVNPEHKWIIDATAAEMPLKAGISGTTHRFLGLGQLLGVGDKAGMRLAMLGHLQAIEAHSFWEICDAVGMGPPAGRYVPFAPVADAAMEAAAKETLSKDGKIMQDASGHNDQALQLKRLLGTDKV